MPTYQEQIAKAQQKKAEASLNRFSGAIADALMPYIQNGKITMKEAEAIMLNVINNLVESSGKGER